jgi:uncharacterized protein
VKGGHNQADLKRLDEALLTAAEKNDDIMFLSELDGFFAGLLVCPDMIPPSRWLKEVWGGSGEPAFDSLKDMQALLDQIMTHYNRVARMLTPPASYGPVMDQDRRSGQVIFADWVEGFLRAVRLQPSSWKRLSESDDQEAIAAFSLMLEIPLVGTGKGELDAARGAKLVEEAPDLIPSLVLEMNRFTKSLPFEASSGALPFPANLPVAPVRNHTAGRNDPCPCGSGKKYKKCCGAS